MSLHIGTDGYWRDTHGSGKNKRTGTFGHKNKVSASKARALHRQWLQRLQAGGGGDRGCISLANVAQAYLEFAADYYRHPDRSPTGEARNLKYGLQPLVDLFPALPAEDFASAHLDLFVIAQTKAGVSRQTINKRIGYVKRMFLWAKNKSVLPTGVFERIRDVPGLLAGRSAAAESPAIVSVPNETIDQTLKHLPDGPADMVRLQLLTGMRPEEVCQLAAPLIDMRQTPWLYTPTRHKTAWRNMARRIYLGPKARQIVAHWLRARPVGAVLFVTTVGTPFTTRTYRGAIWRACDAAFPPPSLPEGPATAAAAAKAQAHQWKLDNRWSPNRLRHTRLTDIDRAHGRDLARALGGIKAPPPPAATSMPTTARSGT